MKTEAIASPESLREISDEIARNLLSEDPENMGIWSAFNILTVQKGQERIRRISFLLQELDLPYPCLANKHDEETQNIDTCYVRAIILATMSIIYVQEGINLVIAFLEEISKIPEGSLVAKVKGDDIFPPIDLTSTLKTTVAVAALQWKEIQFVGPRPCKDGFTEFNYQLYVSAVKLLFTKGRTATLKNYILFNDAAKGAPISDISQWLSVVDWKMYPGQTIIEVLMELSETGVLSGRTRSDLFIDHFAAEVGHKQLSCIAPKTAAEILGAHFLNKDAR